MLVTRLLPVVVALSMTRLAAAQPPPPPGGGMPAPMPIMQPPPPALERHGLFGGGALYGGNISCDGDCGNSFREAGGASGHLGYMVSPRLGLLFDAWAMTSRDTDNVSLTYVIGTVNARLWLAPWIWVQGGVGSGHAVVRVGIFEAQSDDVPVAELAGGVEIVRGPGWALDVTARVAQGSSTDDAGNNVSTGRAVGVGASISFFQRQPRR